MEVNTLSGPPHGEQGKTEMSLILPCDSGTLPRLHDQKKTMEFAEALLRSPLPSRMQRLATTHSTYNLTIYLLFFMWDMSLSLSLMLYYVMSCFISFRV